jgi:hypothetical protein
MFEEMGPPRPCNPFQAVATGLEHPVRPSMMILAISHSLATLVPRHVCRSKPV